MATANRNLSEHNKEKIPNGADFNIGIVVSEWNEQITSKLLEGANELLLSQGVESKNITIHYVPGAFELPLGCQLLIQNSKVDGIIAIGSVIQGETKHFDYVCEGTSNGIKDVSLKFNIPVSFCVLTDTNLQQSIDRSGGIHGNKGIECAVACLKMIALKKQLENDIN